MSTGFEYKSITVTGRVAMEGFDAQLNEAGKENWELVSVIGDGTGRAAYFKRKTSGEAPEPIKDSYDR